MRKGNRQILEALALVLQFGLNMLVPIIACTFLGIWIGKKTNTTWPVIVLFFVGALAGLTSIFRMSKNLMKDDSSDSRRGKDVKKTK